MLQANAVTVAGGPRPRLERVHATVKPGKVTVVLGPNGAGKSTLLRVLAGATRPTAGSVLLDQRPLDQLTTAVLASRRAVVAAQPAAGLSATVTDVLTAALPRLTAEQRDSCLTTAIKATGIGSFLSREFDSLSGGERQRVQVCRALAQLRVRQSPQADQYLLMDEPFNALDLQAIEWLSDLMRDMARGGLGVLVVLHDLSLAHRVGDNAILLRGGQVLAAGNVEDTLTSEAIMEAFGVPMVAIGDCRTGRVWAPCVIRREEGRA